MNKPLPNTCPKCGAGITFLVNNRVFGWIEQHYDETGEHIDTSEDRKGQTNSQTVRCADCNYHFKELRIGLRKVVWRN
jgi:hypothetical protein